MENNCKQWLTNKTINPLTNRKIKENGPIFKTFEKICSKKSIILTKPSSIRVSSNIEDRINYYLIVKKYIDNIKSLYDNVCIHHYKKDMLSVGKNIILETGLGKGRYGIVYKAYFRPSDDKNDKDIGKLFNIVVKICELNEKNKIDVDIFLKLTKLTIKKKCPHFPISYGYLTCIKEQDTNYSRIKSALSESLKSFSLIDLSSSSIIDKNKLYIQINEYANSPLSILVSKNTNITIVTNIIIQTFISIVFFQKYMNMAHHDTHGYNFLCHKINPGGYFHYRIYGKDYYLENLGYLIVINDFGLARELTLRKLLYDYEKLREWYNKYKSKNMYENINSFFNKLSLNIDSNLKDMGEIQEYFYKYLFQYIHHYFPSILIKTIPSNIINKTPYIIE